MLLNVLALDSTKQTLLLDILVLDERSGFNKVFGGEEGQSCDQLLSVHCMYRTDCLIFVQEFDYFRGL